MATTIYRSYCDYCGKAFEGDDSYYRAVDCENTHKNAIGNVWCGEPEIREALKDTNEEKSKYIYRNATLAMKFKNGIALPVAVYVMASDYKDEPKAIVYRNSNPMAVSEGKVNEETEE